MDLGLLPLRSSAIYENTAIPNNFRDGSSTTSVQYSQGFLVARRKGFEPLTPRFEVWCSIQLSYERKFKARAQ